MSVTTPTIRPYRVGHESVLIVGVEGVVEAITDETITIGGIELPRRLDYDRGVRYLSMLWPGNEETMCDRPHCDGGCSEPADDEDARDDLDRLAALIRAEHEANHPGSMRFCDESAACRAVEE